MAVDTAKKALDYVARSECGCITGWVAVDCKDVAKQVSKWMRQGMSVERMSTEDAREHFGCIHRNVPSKKQRELL